MTTFACGCGCPTDTAGNPMHLPDCGFRYAPATTPIVIAPCPTPQQESPTRGWVCPVCGRGNAPWNWTCPCVVPFVSPPITFNIMQTFHDTDPDKGLDAVLPPATRST